MFRDIYTLAPIVAPSCEHILLDALGGRWQEPGLLDKSTNDLFGRTIDAALADALHLFRVLLNANAGDGRPPPRCKAGVTDDGVRYNFLPGGIPEPAAPTVSVRESEDGRVTIKASVRSMSELRKLTRRTLARYRVREEDVEMSVKPVERMVPALSRSDDFGRDCWRAIAKMACNLFAAQRADLFTARGFDPIRSFILHGGDPWPFVALAPSPLDVASSPGAMGPLDHLIAVRADPSGAVTGFVVLFAHLQFCVRLGTVSPGEMCHATYRVDQLGGAERRDAAEDLGLELPAFVPLTEENQCAWGEAWEAAMNKIGNVASERMRSAAIAQLVRDSMVDALGPPGRQIVTPERWEKLSRLVGERVGRLLVHEQRQLATARRRGTQKP